MSENKVQDAVDMVKSIPKYAKVPKLVFRLMDGLADREISVISSALFTDLKLSLVESGLFENISRVTVSELERLENGDLFLLDYAEVYHEEEKVLRERLDKILKYKRREGGLIVYCKPPMRISNVKPENVPEDIPEEQRKDWEKSLYEVIGDQPNTVVVTQYGRLLGDILLMMMTTQKKKG